jgi:hypothetical protein
MGELGHVRAEKQALEQQISDLFALKAKHAPGSSRKNVSSSWRWVEQKLMIDSKGTCTASGTAGDAGTDAHADAGLAGSSEQDAPATTKMNRTLHSILGAQGCYSQGQFSHWTQI